jgi:hypothetical protein
VEQAVLTFAWLEKPINRMGRDLDCMADVLTQNSTPLSPHAISGLFQP